MVNGEPRVATLPTAPPTTPGLAGRRRKAGRDADGLRILYVVSMFPCWSETFIVREIHALLAAGADIRIVSLRPSRETLVQSDAAVLLDRVLYPLAWYRALWNVTRRCVVRPGTLTHALRIVRGMWRHPAEMAKSLITWFRTVALLDDIERFKPDHVHAHWATYASTAAMIVARQTGRSFSFTAHAHDIFLDDQLMDDKLRTAAFVATISRFNREYLRRRYPATATGARIEVVHCGVQRREPAVHRKPRDADMTVENLILSVGRLDDIKGFPTLLRACRLLLDDGVRFRCRIIGEGPRRAMLQDMVARLGLGRHVEMPGARPSQEVEQQLAAARVFVLASQRTDSGNMDGIPVALMEAMAAGTPVVSTRVSGIPELVEDEATGLLVPPRDALALALAIRRMLEDEALRSRCIEGAQRKVRHEFDAAREGVRLLGILKSVKGGANAQEIVDRHR